MKIVSPSFLRHALAKAVLAIGCAALTLGSGAQAATYPQPQPALTFQTSGRDRAATIGDWYTTRTSANTTRFHRFDTTVTQAQLDTAGGSLTLTVNDAESGGANDEVTGAADPTRFTLRSSLATSPSAGGSLLQQQTYASGAADGRTFSYSITTAGTYSLFSETGSFPISGGTVVGDNDDDNGFTLTLGGTVYTPVMGEYQGTAQASATSTFDAYFFVPSGTTSLQLRNFDLDGGGTVNYYPPNSLTAIAGTASGNGVWNGPAGTLDAGFDTVSVSSRFGWWRMNVSGWTANNQTLFQANDGVGTRLPLVYVAPARLNLSKTVSSATPTVGDTVTYTVTLTNQAGSPGVTGLVINDALPAGTQYVSHTVTVPSGSVGSYNQTTGVWTVRNLAPGESATLQIQARVTATGGITNTATFAGADQPTQVAPATGSTSATLTASLARPTVTKSYNPTSIAANNADTSTLTITVGNTNPSALTLTAALTDNVGAGLNIVSATGGTCAAAGTSFSGSTVTYASGSTIPAGGCTIVATVRSAAAGTYPNTIAAGALQTNAGSNVAAANATLTVTPVADLAVTKTGPATVTQGDTATYTIRAWNNGPSAVTGATLSDAVPGNLTNVSWTCVASGTASCAAASGTTSAISVGVNLPVDGGSAATADTNFVTLTVTGTASTTGTFTNTANLSAPSGVTESSTTNNQSSVGTAVTVPVTCSTLYALTGGDFTTGNNGNEIRVVGDTNNVLGAVITSLPATGTGAAGYSATLAIKPDRSKFFVVRDTDSRLLSYDVATALWTEGSALPTPAARYVRMAITSSDVGYVMDGSGNLYRFTTTSAPTFTALPALTKLPASAPALNSSGDFFADNRGNLFLLSSDSAGSFLDFWEIEVATNNLVYLGRLSDPDIVGTYGGFAATPNGLLGRGGSGRMINVDLRSFTATAVGTPSGGSTDLASCTFPSLTRSVAALKTALRVGGGTTVRPGDTLEYTIVVRNAGSVTAGNTQFQDQIPAGTTYVAGSTTLNTAAVADATGGVMPYTQSGQLVSSPGQPAGSLLVDQTPGDTTDREATIKFRVTVNTVNAPTQVSNQGSVAYRDNGSVVTIVTDDPATPAANDATVTALEGVDLSATKTGPAFAKPGETYAYTVTVTNTTTTGGTNVTVTDPLAAGLTFVSASDGGTYNSANRTVTWTLASLAGSASKALTLTVTAPAAAAISPTGGVKTVQNTATVSVTGDSNAGNNTSAPVTTRFVLTEVTKRVRNVSVNGAFGTAGDGKPAEVLEYCLDARNLGGADLPNYVLTDQVPSNVSGLTTGYDAEEPSAATGFGIKLTRGTTGYRTSAADADTGTLTTTGGGFGRGTLTLSLGTLTAGETGTACFQATIR